MVQQIKRTQKIVIQTCLSRIAQKKQTIQIKNVLCQFIHFIRMFNPTMLIVLSSIVQVAISTSLTSHLQLSPANHQLTSHTAYSTRAASGGEIFSGFFLGPLLFFCTLICIWFNQKRAAIDSRRLIYANGICQPVDVTSQASAKSKDGKLVYACGQTRTSAVIYDQLSGISMPNLIKISRHVQVLQWRRKSRRQNNHDYYYYELEWVSNNSSNEGDRFNNPGNWFINNDVSYNTQVYLGGYNIDKTTADLCNRNIAFTPSIEHAQNILRNTGRMDKMPSVSNQYIYFAPTHGGSPGGFMQGFNAGFAGISQAEGTMRVRYSLCPTGDITICARSTGATFTSFPIAEAEGTADQKNQIPDCCCCCISNCYAEMLKPIQTIHLVEESIHTRDQAFDIAIKKSECLTRGLRILCYFLIAISICLFFSPITAILGYIPLVGGLLSGIVGFVIFVAALIIAIPIYFLMTSVAWLRFHPKIGAALLLIGVGILVLVIVLNSSQGGGAPKAAHFMGMRSTHL